MKRLIVCCDGTWQDLTRPYPTNVVKLVQAIKPIASDGTPQIVYYHDGIGAGGDDFSRITGGAFGWGIDAQIEDTYRFLCLNYEREDEHHRADEIYLFGFSRGSYTVRSLAGFIYKSGLLSRPHIRRIPAAYEFYRNDIKPSELKAQQFRHQYGENVPIKLMGCWDTVGELGIPNQIPLISNWINAKYRFHDTRVNPQIENALHAVAIDERLEVLNVTPMRKSDNDAQTQLHQVWFPGTHTCIGGGVEKESGLSDAALYWMMEKIKDLELKLELVDHPSESVEGGIHPDYTTSFDTTLERFFAVSGASDRNLINPDHNKNDQTIFDQTFFDNNIHSSVKQRWKLSTLKPLYRPKNLADYKQWFDAFSRFSHNP